MTETAGAETEGTLTRGSIARRMLVAAAVWSVVVLAITGWSLAALYGDEADRQLDDRLNEPLLALASQLQILKRSGPAALPIYVRSVRLKLFGAAQDSDTRTEIVLLVTPHIVRNIELPGIGLQEFSAGTDAAVGAAPIQLGMPGAPGNVAPLPVNTDCSNRERIVRAIISRSL